MLPSYVIYMESRRMSFLRRFNKHKHPEHIISMASVYFFYTKVNVISIFAESSPDPRGRLQYELQSYRVLTTRTRSARPEGIHLPEPQQ